MSLTIKCPADMQHTTQRLYVHSLNAEIMVIYTYVAQKNCAEVQAIEWAVHALDQYIASTNDGPLIPLIALNIYMVKDDELTMQSIDTRQSLTMGNAVHMAICYVHKWERCNMRCSHMAAIFLEELLHTAYCITDETAVKQKTIEIMNYLCDGQLTVREFYASMPGLANCT